MKQLTAAERLEKVKIALYGNAATTHNDEQLSIYIDDVIEELIAGGVKRGVAESTAAVGCIACGVNDIWNYTAGGVKHSEYFNRRLIQLSVLNGEVKPIEKHERIVVDHATNVVNFSMAYGETSIIRVFVNGIAEAENADFTIEGQTIKFDGTKTAGTEIDVYIYG